MNANDLMPGAEYDGATIETVARSGATVTLRLEGRDDPVRLDRWAPLEDAPDDPPADDEPEPEDAPLSGWASRTSDEDEG